MNPEEFLTYSVLAPLTGAERGCAQQLILRRHAAVFFLTCDAQSEIGYLADFADIWID